MQVVNWEGIRLPRSFHSFIARGARAGEEIHNLGSWLGWGCVSRRRKDLRVELQGKMGDITGGS